MKKTLLVLSVMGLLFSGYMSSVKLFTHTCALRETCPVFMGYPACYFGFGMFLAITVFAGLLVWGKIKEKLAYDLLLAVSLLGILFAGNFALPELPMLVQNGFSAYVLGLPTCMLGLVFYVAIFIISFVSSLKPKTVSA